MLNVSKIVGQNIDIVRNNIPYRQFSDMIFHKTGVRIGSATLQQYVTAIREPRNDKLEAIAKFAEKPVSWFYENHASNSRYQENIKEEKAIYQAYTEDEKDKLADEILDLFIQTGEIKPGEKLSLEKRKRCLEIVRKAIELSKL